MFLLRDSGLFARYQVFIASIGVFTARNHVFLKDIMFLCEYQVFAARNHVFAAGS
jgi:hypothetical protein